MYYLILSTRQAWADDRSKSCQHFLTSLLMYIWINIGEIHLNKYKYAWYWFRNVCHFENFGRFCMKPMAACKVLRKDFGTNNFRQVRKYKTLFIVLHFSDAIWYGNCFENIPRNNIWKLGQVSVGVQINNKICFRQELRNIGWDHWGNSLCNGLFHIENIDWWCLRDTHLFCNPTLLYSNTWWQ